MQRLIRTDAIRMHVFGNVEYMYMYIYIYIYIYIYVNGKLKIYD